MTGACTRHLFRFQLWHPYCNSIPIHSSDAIAPLPSSSLARESYTEWWMFAWHTIIQHSSNDIWQWAKMRSVHPRNKCFLRVANGANIYIHFDNATRLRVSSISPSETPAIILDTIFRQGVQSEDLSVINYQAQLIPGEFAANGKRVLTTIYHPLPCPSSRIPWENAPFL